MIQGCLSRLIPRLERSWHCRHVRLSSCGIGRTKYTLWRWKLRASGESYPRRVCCRLIRPSASISSLVPIWASLMLGRLCQEATWPGWVGPTDKGPGSNGDGGIGIGGGDETRRPHLPPSPKSHPQIGEATNQAAAPPAPPCGARHRDCIGIAYQNMPFSESSINVTATPLSRIRF